MTKLELIQMRDAKITEARSLIDTAEAEKRELTDDENTKYTTLIADIKNVRSKIKIQEELETLEAEKRAGEVPATPAIVGKISDEERKTGEETEKHGEQFRDFGEFAIEALRNPNSESFEHRDMSTGTTGVLVPPKFRSEILSVAPQQAIVRPSAMVLPSSGPNPDAQVSIPWLNQTATQNMFGGVAVSWTDEGVAVAESDAKIEELLLKPKEVNGLITVTNRLLNNATALGAFLSKQLSLATAQAEDYAFLYGDGVGKPTGLTVSSAAISVTRGTANEIHYVDILAMMDFMIPGKPYKFIINSNLQSTLRGLKDGSGKYIWTDSAADGNPDKLIGVPVSYSGYAPALGSSGDLVLAEMQDYIIADGSALAIATDGGLSGTNFKSNKTTIKAVWMTDGNLWYNAPLKQGNATMSAAIKLV